MKINPGKCKAVRSTRARVKNPLHYSLCDQQISETTICKYLGIIIRSDLSWVDQVNYTAPKDWKEFCNACSQKRKWKYKSLAYASLIRPILEYGPACWDLCRGQINALDRVKNKAAQFTNHTKFSDWETLAQRRTIARLYALFKGYSG
jgi:hypothetical protein